MVGVISDEQASTFVAAKLPQFAKQFAGEKGGDAGSLIVFRGGDRRAVESKAADEPVDVFGGDEWRSQAAT